MEQLTDDKQFTMQLSRRLARYVPAITGGLEASIKDRSDPTLIDLALAENRLAQSEVLEIYKAALEDSLEKNASTMLAMTIRWLHTDRHLQALIVSHRAWRTAIFTRRFRCFLQWPLQPVPHRPTRAYCRRRRRDCLPDGGSD
jgi:hypothetical protein